MELLALYCRFQHHILPHAHSRAARHAAARLYLPRRIRMDRSESDRVMWIYPPLPWCISVSSERLAELAEWADSAREPVGGWWVGVGRRFTPGALQLSRHAYCEWPRSALGCGA